MLNLISNTHQATKLGLKVTLLATMVSLAACGGGGSEGYYNGGGSNGGGAVTPPPATVAPSLISIGQNQAVLSTGGDSVDLTISVLDKQGGIIPEVPVKLEILDLAHSGVGLSTPSNLVTNDAGLVSTSLKLTNLTVDSRINHDVVLRVTAGSGTQTIVQDLKIVAGGSVLTLSTNFEVLSEGETATITAKAVDGKGLPIDDATVKLVDSTGKVIATSVTAANGETSFDLSESAIAATGQLGLKAQLVGSIASRVQDSANQLVLFSQAVDKTLAFTSNTVTRVNAGASAVIETQVAADTQAKLTGKTVKFVTSQGVFGNALNSQEVAITNIKQVSGKWVGVARVTLTNPIAGVASITSSFGAKSINGAVRFIAVKPATIGLQSDASVLKPEATTKVIALVKDDIGAPVENAEVVFTLLDPSGGRLSSATAKTNDSGLATVIYTAGRTQTNSGGVVISARASTAQYPAPQYSHDLKLSVAIQSAYITVAHNNLVDKSNSTNYLKDFTVNVVDTVGNPIDNQRVSLSLEQTAFLKGYWEFVPAGSFGGTAHWRQVITATCPMTEFPLPATLLSVDGKATQEASFFTDGLGRFNFKISYGKNYATWFQSTINAATRVSTKDNLTALAFYGPAAADDYDPQGLIPPPNMLSPYGIGSSCLDYQ